MVELPWSCLVCDFISKSSIPCLTMIYTGTIWGIRPTFGFPPVYMDHSCSSSSEGYVAGALARLESISDSSRQVVAILYMGIQTLYASYFVNVMLRCVFGHDWTELPNRTCVHLIVRCRANYLPRPPRVSRYHLRQTDFIPYYLASAVPVCICSPEQNVNRVHGEVSSRTNRADCNYDLGSCEYISALI